MPASCLQMSSLARSTSGTRHRQRGPGTTPGEPRTLAAAADPGMSRRARSAESTGSTARPPATFEPDTRRRLQRWFGVHSAVCGMLRRGRLFRPPPGQQSHCLTPHSCSSLSTSLLGSASSIAAVLVNGSGFCAAKARVRGAFRGSRQRSVNVLPARFGRCP